MSELRNEDLKKAKALKSMRQVVRDNLSMNTITILLLLSYATATIAVVPYYRDAIVERPLPSPLESGATHQVSGGSLVKQFSPEEEQQFFEKARTLKVVQLLPGCGRMQNRLAVFEDGTKSCCKYRAKSRELQSEVYTYHLSKALGMGYVPPTYLTQVGLNRPQWSGVLDQAKEAGWRNGHNVVMTLYVENMTQVYLPQAFKTNTTVTASSMMPGFRDLLQWSDMIVLDYITGHSDRLYCNLLNLQWTPSMLDRPIHNLGKTTSDSLVLYDNESTFYVGYNTANYDLRKNYEMQLHFMKNLCLFNPDTIRNLRKALSQQDILSEAADSMLEVNPSSYSVQSKKVKNELRSRIKYVLDRSDACLN